MFEKDIYKELIEIIKKESLRVSVMRDQENDLMEIVKKIVEKVGWKADGHQYAAGALIENGGEEVFLRTAKKILSKK